MTIFFFNDTATTEIYTLSLHDALPISFRWRETAGWVISKGSASSMTVASPRARRARIARRVGSDKAKRSEEHTSELQSLAYLVCRLLLEKKKHTPLRYHFIIVLRRHPS